MEDFIFSTSCLINTIGFTPLVLIGILITSLTFILNLKDSNIYIKKYKEHTNLQKFIQRIFYTSLFLFIMFIIYLFVQYIDIGIYISILYLICLFTMSYNLIIIVYILKEIVRTSLKDDL